MIYALFSPDGRPAGFYHESVHGQRMRPVFGNPPEPTPDDPEPEPPIVGMEPNPDTTIPTDAVEITEEQWRELLEYQGLRRWENGGIVTVEPPPPSPPTVTDFSAAIQAHLDAKAQERQYDSIHTAIGYRGDPNPAFDAEATALFTWRSAVWTYATAELAKVQAGLRPVPTVEDFLAELPAFEWPES